MTEGFALLAFLMRYGISGVLTFLVNQVAKSPFGAIGVMRVMPATGKELVVGDIT